MRRLMPLIVATCLGMAMTDPRPSLLDRHLVVSWYGNPWSPAMGILGRASGEERAAQLRAQMAAFENFTPKKVVGAYHLVTTVAQAQPVGGTWRRRESHAMIRALLAEARAHGFLMILDVQPGRSTVAAEVTYLKELLQEPDVHLALDPEFTMDDGCVPGKQIGHMHAAQVNEAIEILEEIGAGGTLPRKILILHQFTLAMLPDKEKIRRTEAVDLVLDMDGFGSQTLKLASYRAVMRQHALPFAGFKLFYRQDKNMFAPEQVMRLKPTPALVIYQ